MTDLMQPRYKVIADYPNRPLTMPIGHILILDQVSSADGEYWHQYTEKEPLHLDESDSYPAVLKKLHWSEYRNAADLPKYLKTKAGFGKVRQVEKYHSDNEVVIFTDDKTRKTKNFIPATEDEYNNFINKKSQQ